MRPKRLLTLQVRSSVSQSSVFCDNSTNTGDNLNRSNDCSLSVLSATLPKSGPLNLPSEKSFLLFFTHEKGLGHMFQK